MKRFDPYFVVGLAATLVIGGAAMWKVKSQSGSPAAGRVVRPVTDIVAAEIARLDSLHRGVSFGAADAPIHVIEFIDFECAPCAQSHAANWHVLARYVADSVVRYTSYDLPMPGHVHALDAAVVASCVAEQGRAVLLGYRSALFRDQQRWVDLSVARPMLVELAASVGADTATVNSCMSMHGLARARTLSVETARLLRNGFDYTPMIVLDGRTVSWPDLPSTLESRARRPTP